MTGGAPVIESPARGRYLTLVQSWLGSTPDQPLRLDGEAANALEDWFVLQEQQGSALRAESPTEAQQGVVDRFAALNGTLEAAAGHNLAWVTDRPLGKSLDGSAAVDTDIEAFKREVLKEAERIARASSTKPEQEEGFATAAECVSCHTAQFARWTYTAHKDALVTLQKSGHSQDPECLACHTTGFGEKGGFGDPSLFNLKRFQGVQCESCHGPMKGHPRREEVKPHPVTEETCVRCHDPANSPSFDFDPYMAKTICPTSN